MTQYIGLLGGLMMSESKNVHLPAFTLTLSRDADDIHQRQAVLIQVIAQRQEGFTSRIRLSFRSPVTGISGGFSGGSHNSAQLLIRAAQDVPPGRYRVTVSGTSGDAFNTADMDLVVIYNPPTSPIDLDPGFAPDIDLDL
jgi:hypothetical protein